MARRLRRTLTGTLVAAAVAATLGFTVASSHAAGTCRGGEYESVCADMATDGANGIKGTGKARYLSTRLSYKLTVRLYRCYDDGSGCTVVKGPTSKYRSGVYAFTYQTSYYSRPGGVWCYKSTANLYRKGSDGAYRWVVGAKQSWC